MPVGGGGEEAGREVRVEATTGSKERVKVHYTKLCLLFVWKSQGDAWVKGCVFLKNILIWSAVLTPIAFADFSLRFSYSLFISDI